MHGNQCVGFRACIFRWHRVVWRKRHFYHLTITGWRQQPNPGKTTVEIDENTLTDFQKVRSKTWERPVSIKVWFDLRDGQGGKIQAHLLVLLSRRSGTFSLVLRDEWCTWSRDWVGYWRVLVQGTLSTVRDLFFGLTRWMMYSPPPTWSRGWVGYWRVGTQGRMKEGLNERKKLKKEERLKKERSKKEERKKKYYSVTVKWPTTTKCSESLDLNAVAYTARAETRESRRWRTSAFSFEKNAPSIYAEHSCRLERSP